MVSRAGNSAVRGLFEKVDNMKQRVNKLDHNAAAIKRWRSRLKRAMTAIDKLERQRKRLEAAAAKGHAKIVRRQLRNLRNPTSRCAPPASASPPSDDLGIPSYLKRTPDPVAEQIKSEQAATKQKKARGRIEKMKAKRRGDLSKMPLTGKAALDAIRNG